MREKKLQVFVSSTFTDLKEERQAAVEAILSSGNIPAGMELFSAGDESQMVVIKRWIDESDVYLLILGGRYGSVEPTSGKSYTHLEYEYALEMGKPLFAVVMNDEALEEKLKAKGSSVKEDENPKELRAFKQLVTKNLVRFWDDKKDIKIAIHETLSEFSYRKELVGWIRGDNAVNTAVVADELARLTKENADLRQLKNANTEYRYVGLTFDEMADHLKKEKIKDENGEFNAYEYLYKFGSQWTQKQYRGFSPEAEKLLIKYKIIERGDYGGITVGYPYYFTEDGHAFYLKVLTMRGELIDNNSGEKVDANI